MTVIVQRARGATLTSSLAYSFGLTTPVNETRFTDALAVAVRLSAASATASTIAHLITDSL